MRARKERMHKWMDVYTMRCTKTLSNWPTHFLEFSRAISFDVGLCYRYKVSSVIGLQNVRFSIHSLLFLCQLIYWKALKCVPSLAQFLEKQRFSPFVHGEISATL